MGGGLTLPAVDWGVSFGYASTLIEWMMPLIVILGGLAIFAIVVNILISSIKKATK